ncbi:MAG: hypothetical protein GY832_08265 [Chloroflexi bacterium]|nr:hypothetical protein [Chloroflexota bacterium]
MKHGWGFRAREQKLVVQVFKDRVGGANLLWAYSVTWGAGDDSSLGSESHL